MELCRPDHLFVDDQPFLPLGADPAIPSLKQQGESLCRHSLLVLKAHTISPPEGICESVQRNGVL